MKRLLLPFLCALAILFVGCNTTTPEDKAKEFAKKAVEAIKNLDFNELQKIEQEQTKYLESCSDEDKTKYYETIKKYYKELLGDDFDLEESNGADDSAFASDSVI